MLDVVLIYLPKPYLNQPDAQAPLGLMYISAMLLKKGHSVELKNYASYSEEDAVANLPEATLYGITVTSMEMFQANRFAGKIKKKYSKSRVILGGPGAYHEEFVDWENIDAVCKGEGEYTIMEMLYAAQNNILKKVYIGHAVENIDQLPLPARHLLKDGQGGNIFAYNKKYDGSESTVIISSRGCPYNCSFCSAPSLTYNNAVRFRDPKKVRAEIRHVVKKYGIKQFRFSDDMFTANKKKLLKLCDEIGKEDVVWRISCRVNPLDEEMLKAMWDAGCKELSFGIESFDNDVLKGLRKKATAEDNVRALEMSAKLGFKSRMLLMIRTPFQTKKTIEINKEYIKRVPFNIIACTAFLPIPNSDIWNDPKKYNIEILDRDLDKYNFYMFGPQGRRKIGSIIKILDRPLDEFIEESEEFIDWIEDLGKINKG